MSLILSAQRLMAAGLVSNVAQLLTNQQGAGISISLGPTELLYESSTDNITAYASGGQTSATPLVSEMNRVTTAASAGASVLLPVSAAGLTIIIENAGANPIQVFGNGTDTINGVAYATGVSQMPQSVAIYTCYTAGAWFVANLGTGYAGSLETQSLSSGLTAYAAGGQASATLLPSMVNIVATASAANASVVLPNLTLPAGVAAQITVINNGANTIAVFTPSGGTMNGTSNGSSTLATATVGLYFGSATNVWVSK